jgi:hypothetical protein
MIPGAANPLLLGAADAYQIQSSLRVRSSATAFLSRAPGQITQQKVVISTWVKRGTLGSLQTLFSGGATGTDYPGDYIGFNAADQLQVVFDDSVNAAGPYTTTSVYRDPTAWLHVYLAVDTTQAVQVDRVKLRVNGVAQTISNGLALNALTYWTYASPGVPLAYIGQRAYYGDHRFDGYFAEFRLVTGSNPAHTEFGQTDPVTGQWSAKKYVGTYGTNGFYLDFGDPTSPTTLCYDRSGNGNHWTPNNISTTAGATYDSMLDVPLGGGGAERGNYCVGNVLNSSDGLAGNLENGGLTWYGDNTRIMTGTVTMASGKWYAEFTADSFHTNLGIGIIKASRSVSNDYTQFTNYADGYAYFATANKANTGSTVGYGATFNVADVIGVAYDAGAGTLEYFKNNVSQGVAFTSIPEIGYVFAIQGFGASFRAKVQFCGGQRPFTYTPPTGFKALHTGNLPIPTGAALEPKKHFDVVLATGANIKTDTEAVFPSNFMEWIKDRANVNNHQLIDTVRGTSNVLQSNTTAAETTYTAPSGSSVGWAWKAGGAAVTNTAGSISSQVSANVAAGFSIVSYTGTAVAATVGHGLGAALDLVIVKGRSAATSWPVYYGVPNNSLLLEQTAAAVAGLNCWNNTAPTASVFSLGNYSQTNNGGTTFVAYCFRSIPGYSKIGSYTGNGSADGPMVWCGFRPRYLMVKKSNSTGYWRIFDSARDAYNVMENNLYPNASLAEQVSASVDFTSTGFKIRTTIADLNTNTDAYIFMAFAEAPFKYALAR